MKRDPHRLSIAAAVLLMEILPCGRARAQWEWSDSGWVRSGFSCAYTTGSPGGAGSYASTPLDFAYQGQAGAYAISDAHYEKTMLWCGEGQANGWLRLSLTIVGTIGFFENPENAAFSSSTWTTLGVRGRRITTFPSFPTAR